MTTLIAQCSISGGAMHTPFLTNLSSVYGPLDDFFQISTQPALQVLTHKYKEKNVLEVTVMAGDTLTRQWEESRFYFRANESVEADSLFKLEERGGTQEKFNSVVVLKSDESIVSTLIGDINPHFDSKPLWKSTEQVRDCRSSKMEMLFYAYYMASNSKDVGYADLRNAATMTRWYFGRFFDEAFPSYKDFTDTLEKVYDETPFDRFYHHDTEKIVEMGLEMMNNTNFPVQLCMLSSHTSDKVYKSAENRVEEMDKMFDLSIRCTQSNDSLLILGIFPFAQQTIFAFRGGRLQRIGQCDDESEFKAFIASTCRSFADGKVLSTKKFWNDQRREYIVRVDEDDDEYYIYSPTELEKECEEYS